MKPNLDICMRCMNNILNGKNKIWNEVDEWRWHTLSTVYCPDNSPYMNCYDINENPPEFCLYIAEHIVSEEINKE